MHRNLVIDGFLLTRHWWDTPRGITLSFWLSCEEQPVLVEIEQQQAVCFTRRSSQLTLPVSAQRKPLDLQSFDHEAVDGLYFWQQKELSQLRQHYAHDKNLLLESEIKPCERYLMERFITASLSVHGDATQQHGYLKFTNPQLKPVDYKPDLTWVSLDIETEDFRGKLYSIAVTTVETERVFIVKQKSEGVDEDSAVHWCDTEKQALLEFFSWLKEYDPDVIFGWNVIAFDLDFLQWKCKQLGIPFAMSRGDSQRATILQPQQSGQLYLARIPGRVVLDGIASLRAAFWSFESYALDHVAEQLLGKKKLISENDGVSKLEEIRRLYKDSPQELIAYNLEDCRLVAEIFQKTDLLNFSLQKAIMTGLEMDRHGGSTAAFDNLYLPRLHRNGYVAPDIGSQKNTQHSPGGYVMDSLPGLYENVLVLDFKSLYPSIIRTFKIDPLGLVCDQDAAEKIPGFLGAEFSREQHILPNIVTELWQQRDLAKQERNQPLSQAIKIIMNSFYGVLGSSGCRFFNPQLASSITRRGHEIIKLSQQQIEQMGYQVIYGDTDSLFVHLGKDKSDEQCQLIGRQLQNSLNRWWAERLASEFAIESYLELEFETHYLRFLMPTIRGEKTGSKKRYAGMVNKNDTLKMVFKGLETVRSDWTQLAKDFQQELYRRIFIREPYEAYIRQIQDSLYKGEFDHKLVYSKRLRRPLESYNSTQPPQVKAARKMKNPGRRIQYVITLNGPEPTENITAVPDYQHYVDKQLAPVADAILYFLDNSFEKVTARQMDVFG